jgi:hypothetical protein
MIYLLLFLWYAMCDDYSLPLAQDLLVRWTASVSIVHVLLLQRATCIWGFDALRWDILSNESCHC